MKEAMMVKYGWMILVPLIAAASVGKTFTRYLKPGHWVEVPIVQQDKFHIDKKCVQDLKKCKAWQATLRAERPQPSTGALAGNPASSYCVQLGGRNLILMDQVKDQYDYCEFDDDTLIDSWELYQYSQREKKK